jgi:hypothetical protein
MHVIIINFKNYHRLSISFSLKCPVLILPSYGLTNMQFHSWTTTSSEFHLFFYFTTFKLFIFLVKICSNHLTFLLAFECNSCFCSQSM